MTTQQNNNTPKRLYKYRSLENFKFIVDILINKRLYAAKYFDLNDPMEGVYSYQSGELDENIRKRLLGEKKELRICSLSEINNDILMWSHYANGHRGVAIGVEINTNKYAVNRVIYDGQKTVSDTNYNNLSAEEILKHKADCWEYEQEWRVFSNTEFVPVTIKEIILGIKIDTKDASLVKKLGEKINSDIEVIEGKTIKMK
jgi:hypothetical protein